MTTVIDSIQSLIDHSYSLTAGCHKCNRHIRLDLHRLGKELGFQHSTSHWVLAPKLKCSKCGRPCSGLILAYDDPRYREKLPVNSPIRNATDR